MGGKREGAGPTGRVAQHRWEGRPDAAALSLPAVRPLPGLGQQRRGLQFRLCPESATVSPSPTHGRPKRLQSELPPLSMHVILMACSLDFIQGKNITVHGRTSYRSAEP